MSTKLVFASLFAASMTAPMFGCPGTLDDEAKYRTDGGTTPTCTDAPAVVFTPTCAISGCHTKTDAPASGNLDLETAGIIGRTKDVKSKGGADLLVNSSSPEKSSMYTKLLTPPFGARMPLGGMKLSQDKIDCVLSWIKKEAAGSGPADTGPGGDTGTGDTGTASDAGDGG